jgi:hypothetical protein
MFLYIFNGFKRNEMNYWNPGWQVIRRVHYQIPPTKQDI